MKSSTGKYCLWASSTSYVMFPIWNAKGETFLRIVAVLQLLSCVRLFVTPWTVACQAFLSITNSWNLLKLMSIESVMPSSHLILCHPLLFLPSIFPSIRVFSNESALCINWSFSFSIILGLRTGKRFMLPFFSSECQWGSWLCHSTCSHIRSLNSHWWHSVHAPGISFNQFWAHWPDFKWPVPISYQKATLGLSRDNQARSIWELLFWASLHPLSSFWPVSDGRGCMNAPAPLPGWVWFVSFALIPTASSLGLSISCPLWLLPHSTPCSDGLPFPVSVPPSPPRVSWICRETACTDSLLRVYIRGNSR